MRVIAGEFRSRLLAAPKGMETRPTSDRLRETLFNVLGLSVAGSSFADLYAGSGAIGIEALSRGARQVVFVDQAAPAIDAVRANLASLTITSGFLIEQRSVAASMQRLTQRGAIKFNIVVLDPPYALTEEYSETLGRLGSACAGLLTPEALVVAEHGRRSSLAESYGSLSRTRVLTQGDTALSFYRPS